MKLLTWRQAHWSKYLSQFNLVLRFHPGKLGAKPNALTRQWDIYLKEGGSDYSTINPQNLCPILTNQQLTESLWATLLMLLALQASIIMDSEQLHADIIANLASEPLAQKHLANSSVLRWMHTNNGFLRLDGWIYVPKTNDLQLQILQYNHNHIVSGHFGQNKTMSLVHWDLCLDKTLNLCHWLLQVMHHMYAFQISTSQALQLSQEAPDPWTALELHIHGFHEAAPGLHGIHSDPCESL